MVRNLQFRAAIVVVVLAAMGGIAIIAYYWATLAAAGMALQVIR